MLSISFLNYLFGDFTIWIIAKRNYKMNNGRTIFAQLMDFIPSHTFRNIVKRYHGNHRVRRFPCWDQFLCMAFAQLTYRESLRDIETCLRSLGSKLYHSGIRGTVSRSTLADANERRSWKIYHDLAMELIQRAHKLYSRENFALDLENAIYAFDSTVIELCLSLFPWARAWHGKGGIKLHTLMDVRTNIPNFVSITAAKVHDVNILDHLALEPGAFYVLDRGYLDFARLYRINNASAFFIIRAKQGFQCTRIYSRSVDKTTGLRVDQTVTLNIWRSRHVYPEYIRRIKFFDATQERTFVFLTNNFMLDPLTIASLYKCRWQIELFFKWIKQHLRIKSFYGTSFNAVASQVWIAVSIYTLVAIIKKELRLNLSLYTILQILSLTLFEKMPINQVFADTQLHFQETSSHNQLTLFSF